MRRMGAGYSHAAHGNKKELCRKSKMFNSGDLTTLGFVPHPNLPLEMAGETRAHCWRRSAFSSLCNRLGCCHDRPRLGRWVLGVRRTAPGSFRNITYIPAQLKTSFFLFPCDEGEQDGILLHYTQLEAQCRFLQDLLNQFRPSVFLREGHSGKQVTSQNIASSIGMPHHDALVPECYHYSGWCGQNRPCAEDPPCPPCGSDRHHQRRFICLRGDDYNRVGACFVPQCTQDRVACSGTLRMGRWC
jgi:hypothetical protein